MSPLRKVSFTAIWVALGAVLVSVLLLEVAWRHTNNKVESNQRQVDKSWCRFLETLDYPRETVAGKRFTDALLDLERERGCHGS